MTAAVGFWRPGGPGVLGVHRIEAPQAGSGVVVLRTAATPVNPADVWLRQGGLQKLMAGASRPMVAGLELSGCVEQAPPDSGLSEGQEVVAVTTFVGTGRGAHAARVAVDVQDVAPAPRGVPAALAATLPLNALTALAALDGVGVGHGDEVWVLGAQGSLGRLVVQLARERGCVVTGYCRETDRDLVAGLGAHRVESRPLERVLRSDGTPRRVVDCAVLGAMVPRALAPGSRLAVMRPLPSREHERATGTGVGVELVSVREYQGDRSRLESLVAAVESGALDLGEIEVAPPEEARRFHELVEAGGVRRRLVLDWSRSEHDLG